MRGPQATETSRIVRRTYSVDETAAILGISRSLAYECVKSGEIPCIKFRRRIVIPAYVVDDLIHSSEESAADLESRTNGTIEADDEERS